MAQMTGADISDLESGAARLESVGSQIGGLRRPLRSQLYSSYWEGRAAERFRSQWDTVHGPALTNAEDFLRNAGQRLRVEADQQRRASNMGGGGRGMPGTPIGNSDDSGLWSRIKGIGGWLSDTTQSILPYAMAPFALSFGGVPGLIVGLAVATGNSIPDTARILGETAVDVWTESDLLSDRQRAFVRLAKCVPYISAAAFLTNMAGVAYRASDLLVDTVRYGRDSEIVRQEGNDLTEDSWDLAADAGGKWVDILRAPVHALDIVTGWDWGSRTEPGYWIETPLERSTERKGGGGSW